jgi:hypothetical protein
MVAKSSLQTAKWSSRPATTFSRTQTQSMSLSSLSAILSGMSLCTTASPIPLTTAQCDNTHRPGPPRARALDSHALRAQRQHPDQHWHHRPAAV